MWQSDQIVPNESDRNIINGIDNSTMLRIVFIKSTTKRQKTVNFP